MSLLKDKRFWLFVTFGVIILVVSLRRQDSKKSELPILGKLIDFQLTDQNGEIFSKEDLLGKVWVADFIFTTCAGPCPVMSGQFAELQSRFSNAPDLNLLSISVNPDYDSPEILREYGGRYGANYNKWRFLTGDREAIHELAVDGFKIGSVEDPIFQSEDQRLLHQFRA